MLIFDRNVNVIPDRLNTYIRMGLVSAELNVKTNPNWRDLSHERTASGLFAIKAKRSTTMYDKQGEHTIGVDLIVGYVIASQHNAMTSRVQVMSEYIGDDSSVGSDPYITDAFYWLTWYFLEQVEDKDSANAWLRSAETTGSQKNMNTEQVAVARADVADQEQVAQTHKTPALLPVADPTDKIWHGGGKRPETRAEKIQAIQVWDKLNPDERPKLETWLIDNFGTDAATGSAYVPPSTFRGWRKLKNKKKTRR